MTINLYTGCRLDPTGEHVIPGLTEAMLASLSTRHASITNNHAYVSGQPSQTLTVEFGTGTTLDPYAVNYLTIVDGSRYWRYFVVSVLRAAATSYTYDLTMDIPHTWLATASCRCAWYAESSDRGTFIPPATPTANNTSALPVRMSAADEAGYRYVAIFTQSNGAPRVVLEAPAYSGATSFCSPMAYGVYNSAESWVPAGQTAALGRKIALDRIYIIPADVAAALFTATEGVVIRGNATENNAKLETFPGLMLPDGYKTPFVRQRTVRYTVKRKASDVVWFGGIDGGFSVPFMAAAGPGATVASQPVEIIYTVSAYGLHVLASGGGMARDITSYFDVTPSVNNDSAARNLSRVSSAINSGVAAIASAAVGNAAGVVSAAAGGVLADERARRVTAQHFATTSGQKLLVHGLGFWRVSADNAGDIDGYVTRRGYGCIGVYEAQLDLTVGTTPSWRYLRLADVKVCSVPVYVSDYLTARLKDGVLLYKSNSGYMGAEATTPERAIVVASTTDTGVDSEQGTRTYEYTGKIRLRVYSEGINVATYMLPAVDGGLVFAANPASQIFVYGGSPQTQLITGSVITADFATEQIQISGETSATITAASSLTSAVLPYTDGEYGVLAIDLYVTNRNTRN